MEHMLYKGYENDSAWEELYKGNAIFRELAKWGDLGQLRKLETLLQRGEITFPRMENILHDERYEDSDNIWNSLISVGYLTITSLDAENVQARITNQEVLRHCRALAQSCYREDAVSFPMQELYTALEQGDAAKAEQILNKELFFSVNCYDSEEEFYREILLTLLRQNTLYACESNREGGEGCFSIVMKQQLSWDLAIVLRIRLSATEGDLMSDVLWTSGKVSRTDPDIQKLDREEYDQILTYGIAICNKRCRVMQGESIKRGDREADAI